MKLFPVGGPWELTFQTQNAGGTAVDADALPLFRVYAQGNDTVIVAGTAAKKDDANTTGYYAASGTAGTASGYAVGTWYDVRVAGTVSGTAAAGVIGSFLVVAGSVWGALGAGTAPFGADVRQILGYGVGAAGTTTFPAGTVASTTNITAGTMTTVTNLTNDYAKYMHGAVWVDTVNGATGTTAFVNGIYGNPSDSIANAKTIADNLKLKRFWIQSRSAVTVAADYAGYVFTGAGYSMSVSNRDMSGAQIERCEGLSGTITCPTAEAVVWDSHLVTLRIGEVDFLRCHLNGTVTMSQASVPYLFHGCAGVGDLAGITFAAAGQTAVVAKWSGDLAVGGMVAGNTLWIDGDGELTLGATCTGGTVNIAGAFVLTNNGSGLTINDTARWAEDQSIVATLGGTVDANVVAMAAGVLDASVFTAGAIDNTALNSSAAAEIATSVNTTLSSAHGSGAWGGSSSSSGANTVTVTVTDGTDPIEGAHVRLYRVGESYVELTNASGVATLYLDNATWTLAVTYPDYTYTATTHVISGDTSITAAMTAVAVNPPSDPDACTCYLVTRGVDRMPVANVVVSFEIANGPGAAGSGYETNTDTATSDANGLAQIELPVGAHVDCWIGTGRRTHFKVPDATTYAIPEVLGA